MQNRTITFEDHGQDFLEWDIDQLGVVIGCRPFQGSVWVGAKVLNKKIAPGYRISFRPKNEPDTTLVLNYPVESVKRAARTANAAKR